MKTPIPPVGAPFTNGDNNYLTSEWANYFTDLTTQLGYYHPEDGSIVAAVTNAQITQMQQEFLAPDQRNPKYKQTKLVYNKDTNQYMLNVNGTFKNITVT